MKEKILLLKPDELLKLSNTFEVLTFKNDFDLVYEDQIPTAGIALVEGAIDLIRHSEVHQRVTPGHLLGVGQLLAGTPVKFGCRVKGNSKIILLGKSEVLNYVSDKKSKLFPLLSACR